MTAPRPYSEKPRWDEIGAVTVVAGAIVTAVGIAAEWPEAGLAGVLTVVAGLVIRLLADMVWEP
jgi:hypothetical protein